MSYTVKLTPVAQDKMKQLPISVAAFVAQRLALLGEHPTALSRNSYFPYPANVQLYEFYHEIDQDHRQYFRVLFKYGADEQTLFVLDIANQVTDYWWGKDSG